MTDLFDAYWTASAVHRDASRACRDARRAGAPAKQNAHAVCTAIPWYLIHALREII